MFLFFCVELRVKSGEWRYGLVGCAQWCTEWYMCANDSPEWAEVDGLKREEKKAKTCRALYGFEQSVGSEER